MPLRNLKSKRISFPVKRAGKLKWGVAGCGRFLEISFLPTLQLQKRNKLVSVFSNDIKRANYIQDKFAAKHAHDNYEEFLKGDFEALYISSVNSDHYYQVIKAAEAGKHILCEKPLALTSKEAEKMVDACRKNNVKLSVNYVHRFHPLVLKAREIVENDMLGKLVSVSADFLINLAPNDNFRFNKEQSGGGALMDLGTHMIDVLRYFGGEIKDIKGYVDNVIYKSEVDDFSAGLVKFESGSHGRFNVSFNAQKASNTIEIIGQKGFLTIEHYIGRKNTSSRLIIELAGDRKFVFRKKANKLYYLLKSVSYAFSRNEEPDVTGEDGLVNMKIMEDLIKESK